MSPAGTKRAPTGSPPESLPRTITTAEHALRAGRTPDAAPDGPTVRRALSGERAAAAVVLLSELLARPPVDAAAGLGEKDSP